MRKLKHLPLEDWPADDREAFRIAYAPGDIFDDSRGPAAHHSEGWRRMILTTYRRWLGFLAAHHPSDLSKPPADRITPQRIRDFIEHVEAEVRPMTVSMAVAHSIALHVSLRRQQIGAGWALSKLALLHVPNQRIDSIGWFLVGTRSISEWR